jgi:hypothetical protein
VARGKPDDEAAALEAWDQAEVARIWAEYHENVKKRDSYADATDDDPVVILPSRSPDWPERERDRTLKEHGLALLHETKVLEARRSLAAGPREDIDAETTELDLGGDGYAKEEIEAAIRLANEGRLKARRLEEAAGMSFPRARRLWQWFDSGAAWWDREQKKLMARPGLRWVRRKTKAGDRWTLIRSG